MPLETSTVPVACPRCGTNMRHSVVKTAIWKEDRLYVVEDVPAQVCDVCLEQFYDDEITDALRRLTEDGFPACRTKREILVPIFSLDEQNVSTSHALAITETA